MGKDEFWVYSIDENHKVVPGKAIALKTRKNADLMELIISGGETIHCTPDHKFMMFDGTYKEAKDLKEFDSLMPLYKTFSKGDGYEHVKAIGKGGYTHRLVSKYFYGEQGDNVVHHKNGLWFDNRPENLELKTPSKHSFDHRTINCAFTEEGFQEKKKKTYEDRGYVHTSETKEIKRKVAIENITKWMDENPEKFKESVKNNGKRGAKYLHKFNKTNNALEFTCDCGRITKGKGAHAAHQKACKIHQKAITENTETNHKVLFIKRLEQKEDVYCLHVEKYHNFALSAGVFVHNCGVLTYKLPKDINLDLPALYSFIEKTIPTGFNRHEKTVPLPNRLFKNIIANCEKLVQDKKLKANPSFQAGTLGGGNHFIEVERSPVTKDTYLTIHSGSRKFGLEVAKHHQNKAKALLKQMNISVPRDLEYLPLDMGGKEYLDDMYLAQRYAEVNRYLMLTPILKFLGVQFNQDAVIHSVHNYISSRDNVVRKGAISAHKYEPVVIPLSMGKDGGIVIGEGLGNKNYNYSAPHGAGRLFGRKVMKRKLKAGELTMESFKESMEGVYSKSIVENTIDESPAAYKTMGNIEEFLKETVKIVDIARPILAFKDVK